MCYSKDIEHKFYKKENLEKLLDTNERISRFFHFLETHPMKSMFPTNEVDPLDFSPPLLRLQDAPPNLNLYVRQLERGYRIGVFDGDRLALS